MAVALDVAEASRLVGELERVASAAYLKAHHRSVVVQARDVVAAAIGEAREAEARRAALHVDEVERALAPGLSVLPAAVKARVHGRLVQLTPLQLRLLLALADAGGNVLSRADLAYLVWGLAPENVGDEDKSFINVMVYRLRKKLGPARGCILCLRRAGYCFSDASAKERTV